MYWALAVGMDCRYIVMWSRTVCMDSGVSVYVPYDIYMSWPIYWHKLKTPLSFSLRYVPVPSDTRVLTRAVQSELQLIIKNSKARTVVDGPTSVKLKPFSRPTAGSS